MPMFSVIVPTFNSSAVVGAALQSLARQRFRDFEVVVCDGLSSDDTVAQVEALRAHLPALQVDSRRDGGVYHAINRGVERSSGRWVLVLGSDDCIHDDNTLADAARHLAGATAPFVYGDVRMMGENLTGVPALGRYAGPMPFARLLQQNICQQAVFYRRDIFQTLGLFDTTFRLHADWDFALRSASRVPMQWIDLVVVDYATTGISSKGEDLAFRKVLPERALQALCRHPFDPAFLAGRPALWHLRQQHQAHWSAATRLRFSAISWLLGWSSRLMGVRS